MFSFFCEKYHWSFDGDCIEFIGHLHFDFRLAMGVVLNGVHQGWDMSKCDASGASLWHMQWCRPLTGVRTSSETPAAVGASALVWPQGRAMGTCVVVRWVMGVGVLVCRYTAAGGSCWPSQHCRLVMGVRARSRPTSSFGPCCCCPFVQLQGQAMSTYMEEEANDKSWGSGHTGA